MSFIIKQGEQVKVNMKLTADSSAITPTDVSEIELYIGSRGSKKVTKKYSNSSIKYDSTAGLERPWYFTLTKAETTGLPASALQVDIFITFTDAQIGSNHNTFECQVLPSL